MERKGGEIGMDLKTLVLLSIFKDSTPTGLVLVKIAGKRVQRYDDKGNLLNQNQ